MMRIVLEMFHKKDSQKNKPTKLFSALLKYM